jgi:hypothetical protein
LGEVAFAVAIGGKADIAYCSAYVCFSPKADTSRQKLSPKLRLVLLTGRFCLVERSRDPANVAIKKERGRRLRGGINEREPRNTGLYTHTRTSH